MVEQPRGTVSFLFTDIEGSTRLLRALGGERYAEALDQHREVMRGAFRRHGGYEVHYEGDSFFVAFQSALDAVAAAAEAQREHVAHEWPDGHELRVRMGIHTGEALLAPPKYVGLAIHQAARVMAAGHGGQVLVSQATRERLEGDRPVLDLGEHRLKDLLQPVRLYQLAIEGMPAQFPALRTIGNRPTNLPVQPTPLIGREGEIATITRSLLESDVRLLTLTGAGGTGKTRLALQIGAELLEDFRSGVFFVPLAPLRDPDLVMPAIAQALAIREVPGEDLLDTLAAYLRERQMLLVVDNFEHVLEAGPRLSTLLERTPAVKLLVTSRSFLHLAAERVHEVPPLELPATGQGSNADTLVTNEAVALFVARATAVAPDFELTQENAPAVVEVCRHLDGLPLALELAAARVGVLTPAALLRRLDQRFELLRSSARDAERRHRTLEATIGWSYELLTPSERMLFERLSVFRGGCTLDAAESICDADFDSFASLVEKSLLRRTSLGHEVRFSMLETIREFAAGRLAKSGTRLDFAARHAEYFTEFAVRADAELRRPEQALWLEQLNLEHDNIRAALDFLGGQDDPLPAAKLAGACWYYWYIGGHYLEGKGRLDAALTATRAAELPAEARATLHDGRGVMVALLGELDQYARHCAESLRIRRASENRAGLARSLLHSAIAASYSGDMPTARATFDECIAHTRNLGDPWLHGLALSNRGDLARLEGDYDQARALLTEALAILEQHGDPQVVATCATALAATELETGHHGRAADRYAKTVTQIRACGFPDILICCLDGLAAIEAEIGDPHRAARLLGAADSLATAIGLALASTRERHEQTYALLKRRLGEAADASREAGRTMTLDEAVDHALAGVPAQATDVEAAVGPGASPLRA